MFNKLASVLCLCLAAAAVETCPDHWTQHEKSCYSIGRDGMSWADAQAFCRASGAKLAEIETFKENEFLLSYIKGKHYGGHFWIGGTDMFGEGSWVWASTQETFTNFANWFHKEPDNYRGDQHCLIFYNEFTSKWGDEKCTAGWHFICEKTLE